MKRLIVLWIIFNSIMFGQSELSAGVNPDANLLAFSYDVTNNKSDVKGKTRLDIIVQVPYSSIQFIRKDNSYNAVYNVSVTFLDTTKKNVLFERIWKERVKTDDFDQTLSQNNFNLSYKTFDLNPGKYFLRCNVEDSDSRKTDTKDKMVTVRKMNDTLDISDITFFKDVIKDSSGEKIVPDVSSYFTSRDSSISFFYDIYSDKDRQVVVQYSLNNLKTNTSFKQDDPEKVHTGVNLIKHTISHQKFSFEEFTLDVILKNSDWKEVSTTQKSFHTKIFGLPSSITDLDKAIDELIYIASPNQIDSIKAPKSYNERLNRFLEFWDSKKPNAKMKNNPILNEYYRRIEYANKKFKALGEGWRYDMGMIYVTFGPPTNVERHPMDMNSKPYEIWEYNELDRTFIFLDQTGFGDYRLVNPDYSRWPGYRP